MENLYKWDENLHRFVVNTFLGNWSLKLILRDIAAGQQRKTEIVTYNWVEFWRNVLTRNDFSSNQRTNWYDFVSNGLFEHKFSTWPNLLNLQELLKKFNKFVVFDSQSYKNSNKQKPRIFVIHNEGAGKTFYVNEFHRNKFESHDGF